jgi:hypothetical protein
MPKKKIICSNKKTEKTENSETEKTNNSDKSNKSEKLNNLETTNSLTINIDNEEYYDDDIIEISQLKGKEIWHYSMLEKFFTDCDLEIIEKMIDIVKGKHTISLRFLDWFVTRYSYLYKKTINVNNKLNKQDNFNINISYKAQLKSFTKKYFDPFKRKKKFIFTLEKHNVAFLTTLGQLNFFRWAIINDIISCTETNYKEIISKYDRVNMFFKKHSSASSQDTNSLTSNCNSTSSLDNNSVISSIFLNSKTNIVIDKNNHKTPIVHRNISIEL